VRVTLLGQQQDGHLPLSAWPTSAPLLVTLAVMAVLIDPARWPAHGRLWSHLASDTSLAELHAFAERVGIPRRGFEGDHYDIPQERYLDVVAAGAREVPGRDLLRAIVEAGLRVPKRRGERVIESRHGHDVLPGSGAVTVDLLLSPLPTPPLACSGARLLATDSGGRMLLVRDRDGGWQLPGGSSDDGEEPPGTVARWMAVQAGVRLDASNLLPGGFRRVRLLGTPSRRYRHPSPWAYEPVLLARLGHERLTGNAEWVDGGQAQDALVRHPLGLLVRHLLVQRPS